MSILSVLVSGAVCGLIAAFVMNAFMRLVGRFFDRRADIR